MKKRLFAMIALGISLLPMTVASANSSWRWLSEARSYDVLPAVAALTIAIETVALWFVLDRKHLMKIAAIVTLANLLSFGAPYFFDYTSLDRIYPMVETLEKFPSYTVRAMYLFVTLAVELPVVFLTLRKNAERKWLLLTAIGANIITTAITAAAKRVFCYGEW